MAATTCHNDDDDTDTDGGRFAEEIDDLYGTPPGDSRDEDDT